MGEISTDMKHPASIALHAYWQSCRGAVGVRANGIRAAELAHLLPSLFLFDLEPGAGARLRFCGAEIARRFGRDLADEDFLDLWNADDRATLRDHLRTVAQSAVGLAAGVIGETLGGGYTSFEMLILPLSGETASAGAIGSMVRVGGHEETNRLRARLVSHALRSTRFLPASEPAVPPLRDPPRLSVVAPPNGFRTRYRHLSVVAGGRDAAEPPPPR